MSYNLSDNVQDSFPFEVSGHQYVMRYPTLEEIQKVEKAADKSGNDSKAVLSVLYGFIESVGDAPDIEGVMNKQNMKVLVKFNEMIRTEFGLGEA